MPVKLRRKLSVGAVSIGLIVGAATAASAYSDPDVSSCLDFKHTNNWYSSTQSLTGTNLCGSGTYSFRLIIADGTASVNSGWTQYTPCMSVPPREKRTWAWPRPYRAYDVRAC